MSIVGIDPIPLPYYRTKLRVERALEASDVGHTVLRATQFHELIDKTFSIQRYSPVLWTFRSVRFQPIDTRDVASRLVELIGAEPAGRAPDMGGPTVHTHAELAHMYLAARGSRRSVVADADARAHRRRLSSGREPSPENPVGTSGIRRISDDDWIKFASAICFARIDKSTVWPTALHVPAFVVGSIVMSTPASRNGSMRAADTDRIQVAQLLTDAAAQGRLPMNEYEDAKGVAAQTYDELERISADLPGAVTRARGGGPCRPAPSTLLLAIIGGFEGRGRWNVPKRMTTFALFGGGVVDLRYAKFTSPEVEIHSYSIMGGRDHPRTAGGERGSARSRRDGRLRPERERRRLAGVPCVRIRGFWLWGRVGVERKKRTGA